MSRGNPYLSTPGSSLTRRHLLNALGAGGMMVAAGHVSSRCSHAAAPEPSGRPAAAAPMLEAFPLNDVRLLDGPFLEAQKRDEAYLLKLEADRMLHNFRVNAGLEPKAPIYGGWESVRTWADIRAHGHTLGHYLTAASLMYASTGHDLHVNERTIGSVFNDNIDVPAFVGELAGIPGKIKPTGAPLTFKTDGVGRPGDVTLVPYYAMTHQRYNMYWKIRNP